MSGAESTTEVTPTGRYEDHSLGPLGGHKVHKMVKFRPRGMVDKREMEQAQLFETADERGCTPMFGAAHRRASAVPYPRRYEVCSLGIAGKADQDGFGRPFDAESLVYSLLDLAHKLQDF